MLWAGVASVQGLSLLEKWPTISISYLHSELWNVAELSGQWSYVVLL